MNLVIKPIIFDFEDTYFCKEDYEYINAYGVYDLDETRICSYSKEPYPNEWLAAFVKKEDAEFYLNWKKSQ